MVAGQRVLADAHAPLRAVRLELAVVERYLYHYLPPRAVTGLPCPVERIEVLGDIPVVVEQAAPHPALNREGLVEVAVADARTGRAADRRVELHDIGTLLLKVGEEGRESRFLALAVLEDFRVEVIRVRVLGFGEIREGLPVLKCCDDFQQHCLLVWCK